MCRINLKGKSILGIANLNKDEILYILDKAQEFLSLIEEKSLNFPSLKDKTVVNLFFEPSTRTKSSFELAEKYLGMKIINIAEKTSSLVKGETIKDTAKNLRSLNIDLIVIRCAFSGVPHMLSKAIDIPIINAGDGMHEHPTQALLDMLTIKQEKGDFKNLRVGIMGDILHSRVARSDILALKKLGAEVFLIGPNTLIPEFFKELGVSEIFNRIEDVIDILDVLILLRMQRERQRGIYYPSLREYIKYFSLRKEILNKAKKDIMIMHPGPVHKGVEAEAEVFDFDRSFILKQVKNGLAIRSALIYLILGE